MPIKGCVLHLYVCLFVCKSMERKLYLYETPMYFNYFVYFLYIMSYYVVWINLHYSFNLVRYLNYLPKFTKIRFGFKHLVLYNLVVCYSLDPVLVIWYVTLIIFLQIQLYFFKLKKQVLVSPNWVMKIRKNSCTSHFYCNLC